MTMYDPFSQDYDRFVNWAGRLRLELPFLLAQIQVIQPGGASARVLDAACGTGQHAIALAQAGLQVTGTDLSAGMIAQAQHNAAAAGVKAQFLTAGFGSLAAALDKQTPFDALLCLGNSLPHLLNPEDILSALVDFAACLRPGGLLILQNRNFDAVLGQQERWMEPQSAQDGEREWLFVRLYDFEPSGLIQFHVVNLQRQAGQNWQQQVHSTRLYPIRQTEIALLLQQAGFGDIRLYGDLQGSAYSAQDSGNLVVTARKNGA